MLSLEEDIQEETRKEGVDGYRVLVNFPIIPTTKELVVNKLRALGLDPNKERIYLEVMERLYGSHGLYIFPDRTKRAQSVVKIVQAAEQFPPFELPKNWEIGFFSDPVEPFRHWVTSCVWVISVIAAVLITLLLYLIIWIFFTVEGIGFGINYYLLGFLMIICLKLSHAITAETVLPAIREPKAQAAWEDSSTKFQYRHSHYIFQYTIPPIDQKKIEEIMERQGKLFDYFMGAAPEIAFFEKDPILVGVIEVWEQPFLFRLYEWK